MASLSREVHEVLEQEYVSMYGPLPAVDVEYEADQIIDVAWATKFLRDCGLAEENLDREGIARELNKLVNGGVPESLHNAPLSNVGESLLEKYEETKADLPKNELRELNRRILDDALTDTVKPLRDLRLANVYDSLHTRAHADEGKARTALCISGGGIRSATFALGVIQGLASAKVLDRFDYLSTVSGGGYIGSWLSSWARRHPHGISGVQEDLTMADTAVGGKEARSSKVDPEPKPLRHLREYSNYLSPRMGLLSGDSWTMFSLYLRNVLLNLLVLIPIIAVALAVPRVYAALAEKGSLDYVIDWAWPYVNALCLFVGFGYIAAKRPIEGKPAKGADGQFFLCCVIPLLLSAFMITLMWADAADDPQELFTQSFIIGGVISVLAMTIWPVAIYYWRLIPEVRRSWRMTHAAPGELAKWLREKLLLEFLGSAIGLITAAGLFYILAAKVFNAPTQPVSELFAAAQVAPALRAGDSLTPWAALFTCFAVPAVMVVFFLQATIFVGISSHRSEDHDREWWGRAGAWLFVAGATWSALSAITLFGPVGIYHAPILLGSVGGLSGIAAGLLGFSSKTPANKKQKDEAGPVAKASNAVLGLAVPLFVVFFLALIATGTTWLVREARPRMGKKVNDIDWAKYQKEAQFQSKAKRTETGATWSIEETTAAAPRTSLAALKSFAHLQTIQETTFRELGLLVIIALVAAWLSKCIGVNRFSMHALYRNRLIRAYLGASRYTRHPHPFTGFDEKDNLPMSDLRPELLWATNLKNPQSFFDALKAGERQSQGGHTPYAIERRKLAQHLWKRFYPKIQVQIGAKVTSRAIDAVMRNVNLILLDEVDTLEQHVALPDGFWATKDYPPAIRNRAVLDYYFADVITPAALPKDVPNDWMTAIARPDDTFVATGEGGGRRAPLHVVNMALNLVSGDKLAWQQRMAESFTSSPYHSGSLYLGYRDSREYGGPEGISVGTAVTISGAAASPNMGYHSSPALAFLLTLFNIRLGWWLGNPGPVGQNTYKKGHPTSNLSTIFAEAVGRTNDTYEWVYLSDGGHFENLGLYEMVLRRCHYIILTDAGADPNHSFDDLGNAIRKIRTDLGVPIDIRDTHTIPRGADSLSKKGRYVAVANIRYTAIDGDQAKDGLLVYIKPGCYKEDFFPRDVYNYAIESGDFPHESTADQFFSESQFESYRALGRHAVNVMCENYESHPPIARKFDHVGAMAKFVEETLEPADPLPPAELIASAIKQISR